MKLPNQTSNQWLILMLICKNEYVTLENLSDNKWLAEKVNRSTMSARNFKQSLTLLMKTGLICFSGGAYYVPALVRGLIKQKTEKKEMGEIAGVYAQRPFRPISPRNVPKVCGRRPGSNEYLDWPSKHA